MRKLRKILAAIFAPVAFALTAPAIAQDLNMAPAVSDVAVLSQIVNWTGIVQAAVVIFIAWLLLRFVDRIVEDLGKSIADRRLLLQRLNAFFHFFVYFVTVAIIVLVSFDFSPQALAVIGGASVVAVGFATRDLLASLVAGILIIFDRPFQIGDRVKFGGEYGDIRKIGLRSVKLRTLDDSTVTVPNNLFLSEVVSSSNSGQLDMQTVVHFYIGLDQDVHRARELIREAAATSRYIYLPKPISVGAVQQPLDGCVAMHMRLKAYVLDTRYEKDFETDVTLRVHRAFADHEILPPLILQRKID